jgi:hypothetical protein
MTSLDLVVNLKLREDVLISKCLGRRTCSECGGNFNLADINFEATGDIPAIVMPPLSPPSKCLSKMTKRSDDTAEVVSARLEVYNKEVRCLYPLSVHPSSFLSLFLFTIAQFRIALNSSTLNIELDRLLILSNYPCTVRVALWRNITGKMDCL